MALEFVLETQGTVISLVVSGTVDCVEDLIGMTEAFATALDGIRTRHCICDIRGVQNNLDPEGVDGTAGLAAQAVTGGGRLATIFDEGSRDRASRFEAMVQDLGVTARAFDDPQQAREWLDSAPYFLGT